MLVLSRKADTSIIIGHDITVTVEYVAADDVCLSVKGPEGLSVERLEEVEFAPLLPEDKQESP
jgi:carbon storage regulator CsrA